MHISHLASTRPLPHLSFDNSVLNSKLVLVYLAVEYAVSLVITMPLGSHISTRNPPAESGTIPVCSVWKSMR
jgi:hypothetical protein